MKHSNVNHTIYTVFNHINTSVFFANYLILLKITLSPFVVNLEFVKYVAKL